VTPDPNTKEAERMMEITTSWERKGRVRGRIEGRVEGREEGREEGRVEGQADILVRQLNKKFGHIPVEMENRVRTLSVEKLQELAEAIFDIKTLEEVKAFLT
jgi:predicted transposase YdaD